MKQHITIEQLNELSEKGKEDLTIWLQKKWDEQTKESYKEWAGHGLTCIISGNVKETKDALLLSIGQMMEFLDENNKKYWLNGYGNKPMGEICDALFSAVKEVLEKEETLAQKLIKSDTFRIEKI